MYLCMFPKYALIVYVFVVTTFLENTSIKSYVVLKDAQPTVVALL